MVWVQVRVRVRMRVQVRVRARVRVRLRLRLFFLGGMRLCEVRARGDGHGTCPSVCHTARRCR